MVLKLEALIFSTTIIVRVPNVKYRGRIVLSWLAIVFIGAYLLGIEVAWSFRFPTPVFRRIVSRISISSTWRPLTVSQSAGNESFLSSTLSTRVGWSKLR